jgi:heme-degrading monooxygenase HmoA
MHFEVGSARQNSFEVIDALPRLRQSSFVAIADIELKKESIAEFKQWFSEVNCKILSQFRGFIARILIESPDSSTHKIIFMTEDKGSFLSIRASQQHKELHAKALTFMTRPPKLSFYNITAQ